MGDVRTLGSQLTSMEAAEDATFLQQPTGQQLGGAPAPGAVQGVSQSPTYDFYADTWAETQNTMERLGQAHRDGYTAIGQKVKGVAVLTGTLDYDDFLTDEKTVLNAQNFQKNEYLSKRYLPIATDLLVPMAEALPMVETAMGSIAVGTAAAIATAPVAGPVGVMFGATGIPWATQSVMDAGDIYLHLRKNGANHEVARAIAIPAGIASGYTFVANTNAWSAAFTSAYKKATLKHLTPTILNPMVSKYLHMAGVGGVTAVAHKEIENTAQAIANSFDKGSHGSADFTKDVGEAFGGGALSGFVGGLAFTQAGKLVGGLAKSADGIRQAVEAFMQQKQAAKVVQHPIGGTAGGESFVRNAETAVAERAPAEPFVRPQQSRVETKVEGKVLAKTVTPEELLHTQSADATQREVDGIDKLQRALDKVNAKLNKLVPGKYTTKELALLERERKLAEAELAMFKAEEKLRGPIAGQDRLDARQELADAKVAMLTAAMIGSRKEHLIHKTSINLKNSFGNAFQRSTRGWTATARSYAQKVRLLAQLDPHADKIASNFSLSKQRDHAEVVHTYLARLYRDVFVHAFNKNRFSKQWPEIEERILKAQHDKIDFEYKELANKNHKGDIRPRARQTWEGTEAELIKLYNQLNHDYDAHNGLETGNGYDLNPKHLDGMAQKVNDLVESDYDRFTLAEASRMFFGARKKFVDEYKYQETGDRTELPLGYSGKIHRDEATNKKIAPNPAHDTSSGVNFRNSGIGNQPVITFSRKPESTNPVLKSDQFKDITESNRTLATAFAYRDAAPVHYQVWSNTDVQRRATQVMGKKSGDAIVSLLDTHLDHITVGVPKAQTGLEQFIMKSVRNMYEVALNGNVFQYVKQLSGLPNVLAHLDKKDSLIIASESYNRDPARINAMFSRSTPIKTRYGNFANTAVGLQKVKSDKDPNWFQNLTALPMTSGDESAAVFTGYVAYVDKIRQGASHTKAMDHANTVIDLTNSTGHTDMLPTWNRGTGLISTLAAFQVQPQLMLSRINDLNRDLFNFGFGQAGKARQEQAWRDAVAGHMGVKLSAIAFGSVGLMAKMALERPSTDEAKQAISEYAAEVVGAGYTDYPMITDVMHHAFLSSSNMALGAETGAWAPRTVPTTIAKEVGMFMYDVGEVMSNPETNLTWTDAFAHYPDGVNVLLPPPLRLPAAPLKFAIKQQQLREKGK